MAECSPSPKEVPNDYCDVCFDVKEETLPAQFICDECDIRFCIPCKKEHANAYSNHKVQPYVHGIKLACYKHPERSALHLCRTCNQTACKTCFIGLHARHKTETVKSLDDRLRPELQNILSGCYEIENDVANKKKLINKTLNSIKGNFEALKLDVIKHGDHLKKLIDDNTDEILAGLKFKYEHGIDNLQNDLKCEDFHEDTIKKWRQRYDHQLACMKTPSCLLEIENLIASGKSICEEFNTGEKTYNLNPPTCHIFVPENNLSVGTIIEKTAADKVRSNSNRVSQFSQDESDVGISNENSTCKQRNEKRQSIFIRKSSVEDGELVWEVPLGGKEVHDLEFVSTSTLCLLRSGSLIFYRLKKDSRLFELIHNSQLQRHSLHSLAATADSALLYLACRRGRVVGCNAIHRYDMCSRQLLEDTQVWRANKFRDPVSIAINSAGNIIIADCGDRPPQVFVHNPDGGRVLKLSDTLKLGNTNILDFKSPKALACVGNKLFVLDSELHCVYAFDEYGSTVSHIIGTTKKAGNDDQEMDRPQGICVDDKYHVFVADTGNCRISEFDSTNGNFLSHPFSDEPSKMPSCIAFQKHGNLRLLAVIYSKPRYIKVFQM